MNNLRLRSFAISLTIALLAVVFGNFNFANADMGGKNSVSAPCVTKGNATARSAILKSDQKVSYCSVIQAPKLSLVYSASGFTWEQAQADAVSRGGVLSGIRSQAEQDLINGLNALSPGGYQFYWTSGKDLTGAGHWVWTDTGQVFANGFLGDLTYPLINESGVYTHWLGGEPNPGGELCIHGWNSPSGEWNNVPCGFVWSSYVLRMP